MKIAFCSNFLNHHQLPFCLEMYNRKDINYYFIATEKVPKERLELGYENMNNKYPFVIRTYENIEEQNKAVDICNECDVVIIGSAPDFYIKERLDKDKLTFRYSERIFKKGRYRVLNPRIIYNLYKKHTKYKDKKNLYLLCASAYAAKDFAMINAYKNKCYKWGYFPKCEKYDINKLIERKESNEKILILWAARFISWKHPEKVVKVAKILKNKNYDFQIIMLGNGELFNKIKALIKKENLQQYIKLTGAVQSNKVRKYMENANIFLCTSDQNEGWGAVLNESMNSGCAVIANKKIGSVPYLIKDFENGLVYKNDKELIQKIETIINNEKLRKNIYANAYKTINNIWNAKNAANNIIKLSEKLLKSSNYIINEGPCGEDKSNL